MVVLVFIHNCQVSLQPQAGPETNQMTMTATAARNVQQCPTKCVTRTLNRSKDVMGMVELVIPILCAIAVLSTLVIWGA